MKEYKKYRVDVFKDNSHTSEYFNDRVNAVAYGNKEAKNGTAFLLRHFMDGKYEIVMELKAD